MGPEGDRAGETGPERGGSPGSRGSVLAIVVKRPRPGSTKTRLAEAVGPAASAKLARAFQEDLVGRFARHPGWDLALSFAPPEAEGYFARLAPQALRVAQVEGDLGQRMRHAFGALFAAGYRRAALLAGDVPDLPARIVERAFALIATSDIVLGPGEDGGYYLIALAGPAPALFEGIAWSTERVLRQTLDRASAMGRTVRVLEPWPDIDRPDDLKRLAARLAREDAPATFDALERLRAAGHL